VLKPTAWNAPIAKKSGASASSRGCEATKRAKAESDDALPTRLLHRLSGSNLFTQAELGSYLLFDAAYANDLIALAMEDAHAKREQLIEFFDPAAS
jgi:hypothetical protein